MPNQTRLQHRSMRGRIVDMESIRSVNAASVAIGNANMNANGDILDKVGNIIVRREQIVQNYYESNPKGVKQSSLKASTPETFETPQQAIERLAKQINAKKALEVDEPSNLLNKKPRKMVDKTS